MWQVALEWLDGWTKPHASPRICLGECTSEAIGKSVPACTPEERRVIIEIALGEHERGGTPAHARLTVGPSPRRLQEVVRFCSQQGLPVSSWLITGVWYMPVRVEQAARWIEALATDAGEATVWVDTGRLDAGPPMPAGFEQRLVGHLRRSGCEVVARPRLF